MDTSIVQQKKGIFQKGDKRINRNGRPRKYVDSKDFKLFFRYGIRLSDYNAMLEKQKGVCAICHKPELKTQARVRGGEKVIDSLQVDHDHVTGKVRGLICWKCNVGIMKLLDNRELVESAAKYLGIKVDYGRSE